MGNEKRILLFLLFSAVLARPSTPQGKPLEGKVAEVRADRVRIALDQEGTARIGFQVEIYTPDAGLAGFWLVVEVKPGEATAVKVEAALAPQPGWKARLYDAAAVAPPQDTRPPWEALKPAAQIPAGDPRPAADPFAVFGRPPPGAVVSTRGYLLRLPDGSFQDGFDDFKKWAAARGPGRDAMLQAYGRWKDGGGGRLFLGLWSEPNAFVFCQTYATGFVGLIVTGVCPGSAAEKAGLSAGDLILKVAGEFVRDPRVFDGSAGPFVLEVERDSKLLKIHLEAERHD